MTALSSPLLAEAVPPRLRRRRPVLLGLFALAVVAGVLLPLAFLCFEASQVGWSQLWQMLDRAIVASLLWNTVRLALVVTALCAIAGTTAAFLTERTELPGRRFFAAALVLPLVIPDFVVAWTWNSVFPGVRGYLGAVLVMTLGLYPLVYLPVAAAFRSADPALEEAARSLGLGRAAVFLKVTLRQARSTLLGSSLLVCLALLAEYGAFEDLGYQTFTTAIFNELQIGFATAAAAALSLVLVVLSLLALGGEAFFREKGRLEHLGGASNRPPRRHRLGKAAPFAFAGTAAFLGLALGLPLAVVAYWVVAGGRSSLPATSSLAAATGYSTLYSAGGALIATLLALPVALYAARHPGRISAGLEKSAFLIQALPGLVVALALTYVVERYLSFLYQSPELLVVCYSMIFFPLAIVAVRASVAQAPRLLEEIGRTLGSGPLRVRLRVTLPLLLPGLGAAFCLVFLSGVTELTATLLLVPNGVATLATQFWGYVGNVSYGAAAPYAAMMIVLSALPGYLLSRLFDRGAARRRLETGADR